jgi:hypothetical protein
MEPERCFLLVRVITFDGEYFLSDQVLPLDGRGPLVTETLYQVY